MDRPLESCNNRAMVFLELTKKEFEMVCSSIIREGYHWKNRDELETGKTLIENNIKICNDIWAKLDRTHEPKQNILITSQDLLHLKSMSNKEYHKLRSDLQLSNKPVEEKDFVHISLANALIMWLNSKNLLKGLARFDFTDNSSQYEGEE